MATKKTSKKTVAKPAATKPVKKTVKKTVAKPAVTSPSKSIESVIKTDTPKTQSTSAQPMKLKKSYVILIIAILLLGAGLYYFRGLLVAAVVNGQPISRFEVIKQTEKQSGKQTLDGLVQNALIEQKAKEKNISISDKEINDEITKIQAGLKKQGQNLDQALATQGMTRDDLNRAIRTNKMISKLVGKDVKVTEEEVNDYLEKNKANLPDTDEAVLKKEVKAQLTQQKTNEKVRTWLADVQKQANVVYFVQY